MNKKLIKTILNICCGLGIITTTPIFVTSCASKDLLVLRDFVTNVQGVIYAQIINTKQLSSSVYTKDGNEISPSYVSFEISTTLPDGLNFDSSTGQISGVPLESAKLTNVFITFCAQLDGKKFFGKSNSFDINIFGDDVPKSLNITTNIESITSYEKKIYHKLKIYQNALRQIMA